MFLAGNSIMIASDFSWYPVFHDCSLNKFDCVNCFCVILTSFAVRFLENVSIATSIYASFFTSSGI